MNLSYREDPRGYSSALEIYYCSSLPKIKFTWDLSERTSLQLAIIFVTIACPLTFLLNILVIIAIRKVRELRKNSNILISSLAVADLSVGAVCMPLTISLDALILRGNVSNSVICTRVLGATLALYTAWTASYCHLVIISWERYVAIVKRMEYKTILTKSRLKKYAAIAWVIAFISIASFYGSAVAGAGYEVLLFLDAVIALGWLTGTSMMVNFYRKGCLELRKQQPCHTTRVSDLIKVRIERKIAHTACLLTVTILITTVPLLVVFLAALFLPYFRNYTVFRWAEIVLQINSLVNPLLYFYKNKRYRKFFLQLFPCKRSQNDAVPREMEPKDDTKCLATSHRRSFSSSRVAEESKKVQSLRRSLSCTERPYRRQNTGLRVLHVTPMKRRISLPSFLNGAKVHDALQIAPPTVTVQLIQHTPRKMSVKKSSKLLDDNSSGKRLFLRENMRSKSLNWTISSIVEISIREKRAETNSRRRSSAP